MTSYVSANPINFIGVISCSAFSFRSVHVWQLVAFYMGTNAEIYSSV